MSTTITLKGNEVHTIGKLPEVGSTIRDFALVDSGLQVKTLENFNGKKKVFNIFPSIDTPTCASSARKFNESLRLETDYVHFESVHSVKTQFQRTTSHKQRKQSPHRQLHFPWNLHRNSGTTRHDSTPSTISSTSQGQ